MGNAASKSSSATSQAMSQPGFPKSNAHYEGMPRSPASPHLTDYSASTPTSYKSSSPVTPSPRYGHERMESETEDYGISLPLRRNHVRQLSELIDPHTLSAEEDYVKSPSGNLLGHYDFVAREDRPLSLRERQERIRQQMHKNQAYAVTGITSKQSSPCASEFPMFAIAEESTPEPKPVKKKHWCF